MAAGFTAEVEVVERVGSETYVNLRHGSHLLVARMAPDVPVEAGQPLSLRPDPGALHFFDAASGDRLEPAP